MKKIFRIFCFSAVIISAIGLTSCEKPVDVGGNGNGTTTSKTNTLKLRNVTSYPFKVYVDNTYKSTVNGGSSLSLTTATNVYSFIVKVEQSSGFYQYPLIETYNFVNDGKDGSFNFPQITTGKIKVVNNETSPYTIWLNGASQGTISAGGTKTFTVDAWQQYTVYWKQNSGYILYPSELTSTVKVDANYIYTLNIND
ncbi:MAG: hypothetical protein LBN95_14115 [Prevotellaceae bacterium]|jgi:hypothetical protein|nr:hypothetical protein [Prevotellaceae bacterium]